MARPRRRTQGLLSFLIGKGAGKGRRRRAAASAASVSGNRARLAVRRAGDLQKKKRKADRRGLLPAMQRHPKAVVGETGRRRVWSVTSASCKRWWRMCQPVFSSKKILSGDMRKRQEERVIPDGMDLMKRLSLSFVKKQPPKNRETGIREKARVPGRPSGT